MAKYGDLCESFGERRVTIRKLDTVEEVLKEADVRTCRLCVLWAWFGPAGFAVQHAVLYILSSSSEEFAAADSKAGYGMFRYMLFEKFTLPQPDSLCTLSLVPSTADQET